MGIKELTKYLLKSEEMSESWDAKFRLKDTRLVIDGNGLQFEIFGPSRESSIQCGGEYARFYANVCSFFKELNANGVRSLVVLDGHSCRRPPKHGEAKIWDQTMSHLKQLQEGSSKAKEAVMKNQHSILPLWAKTVFVEALIACKIAVVRSDGEADPKISELACVYRCPVMSGDSDFFPSDLPGGLVHFGRLNFHHPCAATARPILYRRALFVRALKRMPSFRHNTKRQIETFLKLAGALSGNTHVPVEQVKKLYYDVAGRHRIIKALYWLLNRLRAASPEAALVKIRSKIDPAAYQGVLYSLGVHMPIPCAHAKFRGICYQQVYQGDTSVNAAESTHAVNPLEDTDGSLESACPWLFELYHFGLMGAVALFPCSDSRSSKLPACVEADRFGSCSKFDRPLRALLLAMFSKKTSMSEVVYVGGQWTEGPLEPLLGVALDIREVPELSVRDRHQVLLHALHSSTPAMENVPTSLQLAVASLRYLWCRSRHEDCGDQPQVTERHLKALLAGVINGADQGLRWGAAGPQGAAQGDVIEDVIEARRKSLQDWRSDRYENIESSPEDATNDFDFSCQWDRKDIPELDNKDIHVFNAWQRIVGTAIYINHTLKQPLPTPMVHELYDGVQVCELYYHARQDDILAGTRNPVLAENLWSAIIRADES